MMRKGDVLGVIALPDTPAGRKQRYVGIWDNDGVLYVRHVLSESGEWRQAVVDGSFKIPAESLGDFADSAYASHAQYVEQQADMEAGIEKEEGEGPH